MPVRPRRAAKQLQAYLEFVRETRAVRRHLGLDADDAKLMEEVLLGQLLDQPHTISSLARATGISKQTVSRRMSDLARSGFVEHRAGLCSVGHLAYLVPVKFLHCTDRYISAAAPVFEAQIASVVRCAQAIQRRKR